MTRHRPNCRFDPNGRPSSGRRGRCGASGPPLSMGRCPRRHRRGRRTGGARLLGLRRRRKLHRCTQRLERCRGHRDEPARRAIEVEGHEEEERHEGRSGEEAARSPRPSTARYSASGRERRPPRRMTSRPRTAPGTRLVEARETDALLVDGVVEGLDVEARGGSRAGAPEGPLPPQAARGDAGAPTALQRRPLQRIAVRNLRGDIRSARSV